MQRGEGNRKHQVSAGVRKRFSQMTPAEMDRVTAAGLAEAMLQVFPEELEAHPDLAAKFREDAGKVKAVEGK